MACPTAPCQGMPGCQRPAKLNCSSCQLNLCASCDHAVHRSIVIRDHERARFDPHGCDGECDCSRPVALRCNACHLKLCVQCDQMVHHSVCLRDHARVASDTDEKHEAVFAGDRYAKTVLNKVGVTESYRGSTGGRRTGAASTPAAKLACRDFFAYVS
jgi:hypothetical protein